MTSHAHIENLQSLTVNRTGQMWSDVIYSNFHSIRPTVAEHKAHVLLSYSNLFN